MTPQNLAQVILVNGQQVADAITTGSGWEVWLQVQLLLWLRQNNIFGAREIAYPPPNNRWRLDLITQDPSGAYAMELKVQSANDATVDLGMGVLNDIQKLSFFTAIPTAAKWAVGVAYTPSGQQTLQALANQNPQGRYFASQNPIGVLVAGA